MLESLAGRVLAQTKHRRKLPSQTNFQLLRPGGPTGWPDHGKLEASVDFSELGPQLARDDQDIF